MTPADMRKKAADALVKVRQVLEQAATENREVTPEEKTQVTDLRAAAASLNERAADLEKAIGDTQPEARKSKGVEIGDRIEPGEQQRDRESSFGDWLTCVDRVCDRRTGREMLEEAHDLLSNQYRSEYRRWDDPKRGKEVRNLAMNSGTAGGYLMPDAFHTQLMQVAAPMSLVRPRAMVIPAAGENIKIPSLDQTTAQSAGTPSYYGGVVLSWSGESVSITSTEPGFRQTEMTMAELTGYTPVGRTLLQKSAISLEPLIYNLFGGAVAFAEDYAFLRGNGNGKPLGLLDAKVTARVKTSARGSATAITFANATSCWVKVLPESQGTGVWVISKLAEEKVLGMTGTSNMVFAPTGVYTANTDTVNAGPSGVMLYMRPVLVSTKLPALNTDGDFNFFDFSKYVIADGGAPEVASSEDYLFRTNERAFRIVHRVTGSPWLNNPITMEDGSTTLSPFVSLAIQ